jgi:hypothetical protein
MRRGASEDWEGADEVERDEAKCCPSSECSLRIARTPNDPPRKARSRPQQGRSDGGQRKRAA